MKTPSDRTNSGFSLILTLVVLAGVITISVMIARLVSSERRVSQGYSDLLRAEAASTAAVEDAKNLLLELFTKYPDSATYWEPSIGGPDTPGTVFVLRDGPDDPEDITYDGSGIATNVQIRARPLVSGAETVDLYPNENLDAALPAVNTENSVNLNEASRFGGPDPNGWVGVAPDANGEPVADPSPVRVPWVEILEDPTAPRDLSADPDTGRPVNPPRARYAFWVEDESFKLNVNTAKAALRGSLQTELIPDGAELKHDPRPSLQGVFSEDVALGIASARDSVTVTGGRLLSASQIAHSTSLPAGATPETFGRAYKYLLTSTSSGLNLSRMGAKRLNINSLVANAYDQLEALGIGLYGLDTHPNPISGPNLLHPSAPGIVDNTLKRMVRAIDSHSPDFGQRFYRKIARVTPSTPAAQRNLRDTTLANEHADIYLHKLAANIHDYISPLRNPTVVNANSALDIFWGGVPDSVTDDIFPASGSGGLNSIAAIGKKAVPYFQSYLLHAKLVSMTPQTDDTSSFGTYVVEFDHYFGFWNMTDRDIIPARGDLGPDPFLALQNQPRVEAGGRPGIPEGAQRDFEILLTDDFRDREGNLVDLIFPAGEFTVITTDPNFATNGMNLSLNDKNVFAATALYRKRNSASDAAWEPFDTGVSNADVGTFTNVRRYTGTTTQTSGGNFRVQVVPRDSTTGGRGDNLSQLIVGNRFGLLDGFPSLRVQRTAGNWPISLNWDDPGKDDATLNFFRGSQIFAGSASETSLNPFEAAPADPRANLEAINFELRFTQRADGSTMDLGISDNASNPAYIQSVINIGDWAANQDPRNRWWPSDRTDTLTGAQFAPAVVAYGPMRSIGELGHIYDPVRFGTGTMRWTNRRGGGRTLTVGQPDVYWDGTTTAGNAEPALKFQLSRSREWASWRLCDFFTVRPDADLVGDPDNNVPPVEIEGLYNPNGILRDNGRVLKALVSGLRFATGGDSHPNLAGDLLNTTGMDEEIFDTMSDDSQLVSRPGGQALAAYLAQRLTRDYARHFSPIWEPGELSQLKIFNPDDSSDQIVFGVETDQLNDRGREELFRRLVELITPKGNTFSVYVVGQALSVGNPGGSGTAVVHPTATKAQRWTVRLRPVWNSPAALSDNFDPQNSAEVEQRFGRPDSYQIEVLSVEDA